MAAKLKDINAQLHQRMHESIKDTLKWLQSVVRGYFQYSSAWKVARSTILGARSSSLRRSFIVLSVYLLSYSSWRVARDQSRCGPSERGRAMGTCPRGRPVRGHKWNKCGKPRCPQARKRSCPAFRDDMWVHRLRTLARAYPLLPRPPLGPYATGKSRNELRPLESIPAHDGGCTQCPPAVASRCEKPGSRT